LGVGQRRAGGADAPAQRAARGGLALYEVKYQMRDLRARRAGHYLRGMSISGEESRWRVVVRRIEKPSWEDVYFALPIFTCAPSWKYQPLRFIWVGKRVGTVAPVPLTSSEDRWRQR